MNLKSLSSVTLGLGVLFGLSAQASTAVLRTDPGTQKKYFVHDGESERRLDIGWTVSEGTTLESQLDYEKIAAGDEAYISSIEDKLYESGATVNVLVDNKTGKIVDVLYSAAQEFTTCIWMASRACNHTDVSVIYSEKNKLAVVMGDSKWETNFLALELLSEDADGLAVRAKTANVMPILRNDLMLALDKSQNSNPLYRRDRETLAVNAMSDTFQVFLNETNSVGTTSIKFSIELDSYVPKSTDAFERSEKLSYLMNARTGYKTLAIETLR